MTATPARGEDTTTTITDADVGGQRVDVHLADGRVAAIAPRLEHRGEVIDAGGGALLPGLHDHHLHLLAMAAAAQSLDLADAADADAADRVLRDAATRLAPDAWLRVVGYDEHHGPLDADRLDALAPGRCVRVQHRSGAAWVLSATAADSVRRRTGVEVGPDGWVHRADSDLRAAWADEPPPLAAVGRRLARLGVTGVTDCTPSDDPSAFTVLADARRSGALPQRVVVTGGPALAGVEPPPGLDRGPVKVVVADDALPSPDDLVRAITVAHRSGRAVAVHCVTRVGLVLALAAWEETGAAPGDRVEHGSVIPVELVDRLAALGLTVVTQPAFVWDRGDRYLADVEPDDRPHLYRCRSLLDAGVAVGGSTDAPFGPDDPWLAMRAAVTRTTRHGRRVGGGESLDARRALDLFLTAPDGPGGPPRTVTTGAPADLCLLDAPLSDALADPDADRVRHTWIAGIRADEQR